MITLPEEVQFSPAICLQRGFDRVDRLDKFHLVQDEYRKLDAQWLRLHVVILSLLAALVMLAEIAMYFILNTDNLITSSPQVYLLKYLLFPTACDGICVVLAWWAVRAIERHTCLR